MDFGVLMCVLVAMVDVKRRWLWILECLAVVAGSFVDFSGIVVVVTGGNSRNLQFAINIMGCICGKPSATDSPRNRRPRLDPCFRFTRKIPFQLVAQTSKIHGHAVASISNGGGVTEFCKNQELLQSRKVEVSEATKGRGLHGKLNGGSNTSVIGPSLRENCGCDFVCSTADFGQGENVTSWLRCHRFLWHLSHEGDILEDLANKPKKDMYMFTMDPEEAQDKPEYIEIGIESGLPVSVNGKEHLWQKSLRLQQIQFL
ncbi:hypothetical protein CMV_021063 [Castanea mollissima]|uniref:argininosuccinate synthase n=1 Tax=Castanea mollissima TaxID=60419 RepID=A0A8J4VL01_9ROSI|nr:hypothetical protein CMV_021063 [Castanea mollissima]